MAKRHDSKAVKQVIAALDDLGIDVAETMRRLKDDECDLGYSVEISKRMVYYHRTAHRQEKARAEAMLAGANASITAAKQRATDLIVREITALEARRPGTITPDQARTVGVLHQVLNGIANRDRPRGKAPVTNGNGTKPERELTALDKLAGNGEPQAA